MPRGPDSRNATLRQLVLAAGLSCLTAVLWCAGPVAAQEDDPPRQDFQMGNTENMRMGRDAAGNTVMEVRRPPKDPAAQPPVGPFFIYPQVGGPYGSVSGGQNGMTQGGMGQGGMRSGQSGQGSGGQNVWQGVGRSGTGLTGAGS